jgi:hypothetical protein
MRSSKRTALIAALVVVVVGGCGHRAVSLHDAAASDWPKLDNSDKTKLAKACISEQTAAAALPQQARRAVARASVRQLVARLDLYYRTPSSSTDGVQQACRIVIRQRYAPAVRITKLMPGRVMPASERFLRMEGTVTAGASVHMDGGERSMPAAVNGTRFTGVIEVEPGRHSIFATARFPDRAVQSKPIVVTRIKSAENLEHAEQEEAKEEAAETQRRKLKRAREAAAKK